jgi:hypothetical protein
MYNIGRFSLGFEVLTAMSLGNMVFCVEMPCYSKTVLGFGGIYGLHLQGGKVSHVRNHQE